MHGRSSWISEYVWMHSNHFINTGTSFMFSEAIIPFKVFHFNGLIVNLIINGQEYHFRRAQMDKLPNGDYTFELTC